MTDAASAALGVYKPRRPQASPLFRLVSDHLHRLQTVHDDRFAGARSPPSKRAPASRSTARAPRPSANAPPPLGDLWRGRPFHRCFRLVPAGIVPPR